MICAPKRKAVGSNPAGEAKKALNLGLFSFLVATDRAANGCNFTSLLNFYCIVFQMATFSPFKKSSTSLYHFSGIYGPNPLQLRFLQKSNARSIQPSAAVPVPGPTPCSTPGKISQRYGTPACSRAVAIRRVFSGLTNVSASPHHR